MVNVGTMDNLHVVDSKPTVVEGKMKRFGNWMKRHKWDIASTCCFALLMGVMIMNPALAKVTTDAGKFKIGGLDDLQGLAFTIVKVLGGIVAGYGGIQFGLGMANDNPDSQSRGLKMMIGGVLIMGASFIVDNLTFGS